MTSVRAPQLLQKSLKPCSQAKALLPVHTVFPVFRTSAPRRYSTPASRGQSSARSFITVVCALGASSARVFASSSMPSPSTTATFAGGCFWGIDNYFNKHFKDAIVSSEVGYTGGEIKDPDYRRVCSGSTGHAEAVRFEYDPAKTSYGDLVEYFYRIHDPTTPNRQGNDMGTQYRSAIFYEDDEQKRIAEEKTAELQKARFSKPIATEIVPAEQWWSAEDYHQQYLVKNPGGYCNHRERW